MRQMSTVRSSDGALLAGSISRMFAGSAKTTLIRAFCRKLL
jgi:hypothetical protein